MRAEDLRVMTEGDRGWGKQEQQKSTQRCRNREVIRQNWWQKQLAKRDRWQAGKAWRDSIEMTKTVHLTRHHLNLNDLAVLPDNKENAEKHDLVQSSNTKGTVSSTDEKNKITTKSDSWGAAGKLVCFLIIISTFLLLVFSLKFISTFLFFWKSSDWSSWKHPIANGTQNSFLSDNSSQFNYVSRRTGLLLLYPSFLGASMSWFQTTWILWSNSHLRFR